MCALPRFCHNAAKGSILTGVARAQGSRGSIGYSTTRQQHGVKNSRLAEYRQDAHLPFPSSPKSAHRVSSSSPQLTGHL